MNATMYLHSPNDWREVPAEGATGPVIVGYKAIHRQVLVVAVVNFFGGKPVDGARFYVTPVDGQTHEVEVYRWQKHGSKNQRVGAAVLGTIWDKYNSPLANNP